jgi:DNA-directed RNA polymerase specialized sigma24 family protein
MSAAKTQYLIDQVNFTESPLIIWQKLMKSRQNSNQVLLPHNEPKPDWIVWPEGLNPDIWKEFLIRSSRLSVDVLILSFILKMPDIEISEILGLTEGGVLIALSEGLARLGEYIK